MKALELPHIDNNFFRLTVAQAKRLAVLGRLPAPGRERRGTLPSGTVLRYRNSSETLKFDYPGWVLRTPVSYIDGKPNPKGWVWAFHFHRSV